MRRSTRLTLAVAVCSLLAAATARAQDQAGPQITFLAGEKATAAIVDETAEPYFKLLTAMEMTAKTGKPITGDTIDQQRDECRRRYRDAVSDFTAAEQRQLTGYVKHVHQLLAERYPGLASQPWRFIKLDKRIEAGLPHTRGGCIVISSAALEAIEKTRAVMPQMARQQATVILLHEQLHVIQRGNPKPFTRLYSQVWGFEHADKIANDPSITDRRVVNPDGVDVNWVFPIGEGETRRWIQPDVIFRAGKESPRMPADFRMVAVSVEKKDGGWQVVRDDDGKVVHTDLMRQREYLQAFGGSRNIYHPNEAAAQIFSEMVLLTSLADQLPPDARQRAEKRYETFRKWCDKEFGPDAAIDAGKIPDEERAQQISDLKFGMFICWSFSTVSGQEWTKEPHGPEFFNVTAADTDQWCTVAKAAGMNYILFLAKHHDGFCLWDTKTSKLKVTNSPLGIDVLAKLRKSCDRHGLKLALYFSEGDWRHPRATPEEKKQAAEYKKAQLKELCTNYGPIEFFWMDHAACGDGGLSHVETVKWVQRFQPNCFVGFNHGQPAGRLCLRERGTPGKLGDPATSKYNKQAEAAHKGYRVAELTYPISSTHWFDNPAIKPETYHSAEKIFADYQGAVKFGNIFSLDVGPSPEGKLRDRDVKLLQRVGEMIRAHEAAQSKDSE